MRTSKRRLKAKRLHLEYESSGWRYRIAGVPAIVDEKSGEELIAGKTGLQLLNILKKISRSIGKVKNLPKAEVEIKFSKVA